MSSQQYSVQTYGLLIPRTYEEGFIKAIAAKNDQLVFDDFWDMYVSNFSFNELDPLLFSNYLDTVLSVDVDDNDATFQIIASDYQELDSHYIDGGLVIPLSKQPSLFESAYDSLDDVIEEMTYITKGLLPDDFNYKGHIGLFQAIYY